MIVTGREIETTHAIEVVIAHLLATANAPGLGLDRVRGRHLIIGDQITASKTRRVGTATRRAAHLVTGITATGAAATNMTTDRHLISVAIRITADSLPQRMPLI